MRRDIQAEFFNTIKSLLPEYQNLAQTISEVLDISLNESYKKIKGLSQLNLAQIEALCCFFNISFTYSPNHLNTVTFSYKTVGEGYTISNYLDSLLADLNVLKQVPQKHVTITTEDIPLFYLFKYPDLACFKLFFWQNSFSTISPVYIENELKETLIEKTRTINEIFLQLPSTEIWSKNSIHNTIEQVRYIWEAGIIEDKAILSAILTQLISCLEDINAQAMTGKKNSTSEHVFNWYSCDNVGSIVYLVEIEKRIICYNRFNTFDYQKTDDLKYCTSVKLWADNLVRRSTGFSGQGEKYRNKYIYNGINECKRLLEEVSANQQSFYRATV